MSKKVRENLSDDEVDRLVVAQAGDDSAWGKPVRVSASKSNEVSLSAELASRAAFFARLHRERSVQHWLQRIIEERIEIEEAAFAESKRDLSRR